MASWNFPGNQGGQIKGVSDAGIENFSGNELGSLVRENCQNSLDAAENEENPNVIVEFERKYIDSKDVPGIVAYRKILKKCNDFWGESKSDKAKTFLKTAINKAESDRIAVLRISDYNTIGLSNPYQDINGTNGLNFDGWNALIKIDGGANKGDDKAGAYGIGKNAPFCNSYYRLVFYRTLNKNKERAAQGVSRLMTFTEHDENGKPYNTCGIGYYGNAQGNNPVEIIHELENLNERSNTGTDVFVYGFKDSNTTESDIIISLLDNFLMSLHYGFLCVKLQNKDIDNSSLSRVITEIYKKRPKDIENAYGNYLALTRTDGVFCYEKKFHELGTLQLRILVDPKEKLDRKVLVVRKAGMKLFRLSHISKLVPFTGILELKGKELNSFFREMESVAHDSWEPGRHSKKQLAKEYFEEIKDWIRSVVSKLAENSSDDEIDVNGLSDVLQAEADDTNSDNGDNKDETLNNYLDNLPEIIERPARVASRGFFHGRSNEGHGDTKPTSGKLGKEGDSGIRILAGTRHRKRRVSHKGIADPNGRDIVNEKQNSGQIKNPLNTVRIIKQGVGQYCVTFQVEHDFSKGHVELVTVGENGSSNKLRIKAAQAVSGCEKADAQVDSIELSNVKASEKIKITVTLDDTYDYAMELNVYEHN